MPNITQTVLAQNCFFVSVFWRFLDVKILLAFLICQFIIEDCHLDHIKLSDRQSDYVTLIRGMVVLNTSSIVLFVYNIYLFLLSVHGKPLVNHINRIPIAATVGHKVGPSSSKNETNITTKRYFGLPPGFSYGGHAGGGRNNGGGGFCEHGHLGDIDALAGHEGFHASQHLHHHHERHHDDSHHAPAYGHSGGHSHDDEGIAHSHYSEENPMMSHTGPGVDFHTGMVHMDAGGHLSRGGHHKRNIFVSTDLKNYKVCMINFISVMVRYLLVRNYFNPPWGWHRNNIKGWIDVSMTW